MNLLANARERTTLCARRLLDQQMWCFGQDIRYPPGNLLLNFGFTRHRKDGANSCVSAYSLRVAKDEQLVIWGFGLFYGMEEHGGIYLRRYQFHPIWCAESSLSVIPWQADEIGKPLHVGLAAHKTRIRYLLANALCRLADYETWVLDTVGLDFRRDCLNRWTRPGLEPDLVPAQWRCLAIRWGLRD